MKAIGGYPELELHKGEHYHKDAIRLNTARNCLEYILLARSYSKVYIPYYTCEAVLEPFRKSHHTKIEFYSIDKNLAPFFLPSLKENEAFLYTNYFGLKQETVERLVKEYGSRLIVDNSQAFFDMPHPGIDTFYSARKFFGVPDGAYLYTNQLLDDYYGAEIESDKSYARITALVKRIDLSPEEGYTDFQEIEESLNNQPIKSMSSLTEAILSSIDYEQIKALRRENYISLYWPLFNRQTFWTRLPDNAVPLCYPFLSSSQNIRQNLIRNRIYVPTYWPNVLNECDNKSIEYNYAQNLLPLPVDQRYGKDEMKRIVNVISANV